MVNIFTGPPKNKEDDEYVVHSLMEAKGTKVVAGGTSSDIVARVLGREITTNDDGNGTIPPTSNIKGLDLVLEGVVTLSRVLALLKQYARGDLTVEFFFELDADNGASRLARLLIEECTDIHMFVGTAVNSAYLDKDVPFEYSMRMSLVKELQKVAESIGKKVIVEYY